MAHPDHDAVWSELHANTPNGWYVGRPSGHLERTGWIMFAFDIRERPVEGKAPASGRR